MAALIGALRVSLSAETAQFEAGMKRAQRTTQASASAMNKSLGLVKAGLAGLASGLSAGLIFGAAKAALDYAASLGETADQLGVTTRELQNFRAVAMQSGASMEEADSALGKLTLNMSKALSGSKQAAAAFSSVGVSISDMTTKSRWEIIGQIADQMNRQGGAAKNAAAGVAIFGRGFQKIIPTLNQGSAGINDLADANERLGGVLSDPEIQSADKTADKIEQLFLVLKTKLASDIAANSNAIAEFTKFLFDLVTAATQARQALSDFEKNYNVFNIGTGKAFGFGHAGRSVTTPLGQGGTADVEARRRGLKLMSDVPRGSGGAPPPFLAGGGGGSKKSRAREDHSAERALSDAHQFDQDIRRAQQDVLQAMQNLSTDAVERYAISIQIKDAEKAAYEAELEYQKKLYKLTDGQQGLSEAQAAQLKLQYDKVDQLERDKLIADENRRAFEESARLADLDFELQRDRLESEEGLAETAKSQRDVQLRLLDLAYRQERAKLETILADEQSSDLAKEEARRRLANLNHTYSNDRQGVINNTRGPMEQFHAQFSDISDEMEQLKVDGINAAASVLAAFDGDFGKLRDNAIQALQQIISELIRIQLLKAATSIFGGGAQEGAGQAAQAATLQAAGATLSAAGGTLSAAGGTLTAAGGTLTAGAAPLMGAGTTLTGASISLQASAAVWMATAAQIQIAAATLMAANAASSAGAGFASGGYTGNVGVSTVAGVVHGQEFVVNAKATKRFLPLLHAINAGKVLGMSKGGLAGLPIARIPRASNMNAPSSQAIASGGNHFSVTVNGAMSDKDARRTGMQIALAANSEMSRARNKGLG